MHVEFNWRFEPILKANAHGRNKIQQVTTLCVLLANNVVSVCMGLKVWPVSNYTQQVLTLLWFHANGRSMLDPTMLRVVCQQCCVCLHGFFLSGWSDQSVLKWNARVLRTCFWPEWPCSWIRAAQFSRSSRSKRENPKSFGRKNVRVPWIILYKLARTSYSQPARTKKWKATQDSFLNRLFFLAVNVKHV